MNNYNSGKLKNEKDPCCLSRSGRRLRHVYSSSSLMNMEKAENEENGTTNSVNNPPPLLLPTTVELFTHYVFAYKFHLDQV